MKIVPVTQAKAHLTALVHDAETEDVTLVRHGKPAAVLISSERYQDMIEQLEDLEDLLAVKQWRDAGSPAVTIAEAKAAIG